MINSRHLSEFIGHSKILEKFNKKVEKTKFMCYNV